MRQKGANYWKEDRVSFRVASSEQNLVPMNINYKKITNNNKNSNEKLEKQKPCTEEEEAKWRTTQSKMKDKCWHCMGTGRSIRKLVTYRCSLAEWVDGAPRGWVVLGLGEPL